MATRTVKQVASVSVAGARAGTAIARTSLAVGLLAIVWGALAFGAVYPWAYWPLAVACQLCGLLGLLAARDTSLPWGDRGLLLAFAGIAAAVSLQLVPLPVNVLAALSPAAIELLRNWNLAFAMEVVASHPLSVSPEATRTALFLFASFALMLFGASRALSLTGCSGLVRMLTAFGVLLAVIGVAQQPLYGKKIYGFWTPIMGGNPFGPFVNKNHFAGWMLMTLPLTMGLACAGIEQGMRGVRPHWRSRLLWFSSREANALLLLAGATLVMALSLVMTMSRSGIGALAVALVITAGVGRRRFEPSRLKVGLLFLGLLVAVVVGWVGVDVIGTRFAAANWGELNNRRGAWADALQIARAFPLAGAGLNTYGVTTLFYQRHDLTRHYVQAHNDYLQILAEGGVLLAVPAAASLFYLIRQIRRRFREEMTLTTYWLRVGAVTALLAIALQETVEFSLQMPGNAALFAVICAIALHRAPEELGRRRERFRYVDSASASQRNEPADVRKVASGARA